MITETYRPNLADNRILQVIRCCEAQKHPETLMSFLVPLVLKMLVMLLEHGVRALHMSLKAVGHLYKRKVMAETGFKPIGALLFQCCARGAQFHGKSDHIWLRYC